MGSFARRIINPIFDTMPAHMLKSAIVSIIICFTALFVATDCFSQSVRVKDASGQPLLFPWAGGLDACQFGEIDLNQDGKNDLFVFDRRGNRKLCFLNTGTSGTIAYTYAPAYAALFPELEDWVVLADYDRDGKPDIFTYSPGWAGMKVYRNTSGSRLSFTPVAYPYLKSLQGSGYVNIISTNADYPAIVDIDNDGDLDILTFWALGSFIEMHQNRSIELYGHADSLDFEKVAYCWGRIAENDENDQIYLDTCIFNPVDRVEVPVERHRGSTMLVYDANNSGLPDLVLADVDYPGVKLLTNGGTPSTAFIISQDTLFPSAQSPVRLFSMPVLAHIDVNNDGLPDLLVSPFDPSLSVTENNRSVWLYLNYGTSSTPDYQLVSKNFLQGQMIDLGSGAYPVFVDLDNDGLTDLVAGNYGYYNDSWYEGNSLRSSYTSQLAYFRNVGTIANPMFQLRDIDLGGLSSLQMKGLCPAFADLNNDGLTDMLVGAENGQLIKVIQSTQGNWTIETTAFGGISVGSWSAPQLFDLDGDQLTDLILGAKNGKLVYYKGSSEQNDLLFTKISDRLGNVDVTDYELSYDGYSVPCFFRHTDNTLYLVVGSEQGQIYLYDEIEQNLGGDFHRTDALNSLLDTTGQHFDAGMRSAAAAGLLIQGKLSMVVGNYSGGLELYNANVPVLPGADEMTFQEPIKVTPMPVDRLASIECSACANQPVMLQLINPAGQLVWQQEQQVASGITVNTGQFPSGVYMLVLRTKQQAMRLKIIIAH